MSLFSSDLNLILDSFSKTKIEDKISRDYIELEILQNSFKGTEDFTNKIIEFIKLKLFDFFQTRKQHINVVFQDENLDNNKSEYRYFICPLCGSINLSHSLPNFTISIALQKLTDDKYETICGVINSPMLQDIYIVEKGKGAYINSRNLNTRKIKVSSRKQLSNSLVAIKNTHNNNFILSNIEKYNNLIVTNCEILNICNVASGKYDLTILDKSQEYQDLPLLLVKEAGGKIIKLPNGEILVYNNSLNLIGN